MRPIAAVKTKYKFIPLLFTVCVIRILNLASIDGPLFNRIPNNSFIGEKKKKKMGSRGLFVRAPRSLYRFPDNRNAAR